MKKYRVHFRVEYFLKGKRLACFDDVGEGPARTAYDAVLTSGLQFREHMEAFLATMYDNDLEPDDIKFCVVSVKEVHNEK